MNEPLELGGTVALVADVHGNLPALEAVLGDMTRFDVTEVVSLGDMANFGPAPREALRRLRALEPVTVMGNTDHALLEPRTLADVVQVTDDTPRFLEVEDWCAQRLTDDDRDFVRSFRPTVTLSVDGVAVLAYHGSPLSFDHQVRSFTPDETLDPWFADWFETGDGAKGPSVLVGAHTHEQFLKRYHDALLINPGAVGLPIRTPRGGAVEHPTVAEYALLSVVNGQPNVNLRRVRYDLDDLRALGEGSEMPHWEWWFEAWRQA